MDKPADLNKLGSDRLICLTFYASVASYRHVGTLSPFYGSSSKHWDDMTSRICHNVMCFDTFCCYIQPYLGTFVLIASFLDRCFHLPFLPCSIYSD